MRRVTTALSVFACCVTGASAQTIYEPLVTQYGGQNPYDYAGSDPRVHAAAAYPSLPGASYGRGNGYAFVSARRSVVERAPRVFVDFFAPHWVQPRDVTTADVINAAHASLPRYVRKADLVAERYVERDDATTVGRPRVAMPKTRGSIIIIRRAPKR